MALTTCTFLYQNLISGGGMITATSERVGFEKKYLCDKQYSTTWRSSTAGVQNDLLVDFSTPVTINCIALGNHNLKGEVTHLQLHYGTTLACADGFIDLLSDLTTSKFLKDFTSVTKRYWKLEMAGATLITFFEIGQFWLGVFSEVRMPRVPIANYDPDYVIYEKRTSGGQLHSYELYEQINWPLVWGHYNITNHSKLLALWKYVKRSKPFWIFLDPANSETLNFVFMKSFNFSRDEGETRPGSLTVESAK